MKHQPFRLTLLALAILAGPLAHAGNNYYDTYVDSRFAVAAKDVGWRRVFSSGTVDEKGVALARTSDGGFVALISVPGGVVGSRIGLRRYGPDATLVSSGFGTSGDGRVLKDAYLVTLTGMIVDHLGRIVVIGTTPGPGGLNDFGVVRFNADGSDDTSFGGDGGVAVGMEPIVGSSDDNPVAVVEQVFAGGVARLVIAGNTLMQIESAPLQRFGLIGLRDDGSLDPDFGNYLGAQYEGRVNDNYSNSSAAYASSLIRLPDNGLIIGGTSVFNSTDTDFGACYLNAAGSPFVNHSSCITMGIDEPGPGGSLYDGANAMALTASDTVVVAGNASNHMAAVRLKRVGTALVVDSTFVGSMLVGRPNRYVGFDDTFANDVAVRSDGSLVIAGRYAAPGDQEGAVTRLLPDGMLDLGFNYNGFMAYQAPVSGAGVSGYTEFNKVLIDAGRPVLFGSSPDNTTGMADFDGVMTRLFSDLIFRDGME